MKPLLTRTFYRPGIINHRVEFFFLLSWFLLFPAKESYLYFAGYAFLICLFSFRSIYFMKTAGLSYFSYLLPLFNFILIFSLFFSNYLFKSLNLFSDIFLISCYFILFYNDKKSEDHYFHLLAYILSVFSLINVIRYALPVPTAVVGQRHIFFISSIHEGIISGIGTLTALYYLLGKDKARRWDRLLFSGLIILNVAGVYVSGSKAAFAGTVFFSVLIIFALGRFRIPPKKGKRTRRLSLIVFVIVIVSVFLTFVIPNPIKTAFYLSLKKDPYVLDRIDIWKMSTAIFKDHWLTGVGLDNFSEVSGRYNFKQTRGPANYFKVPHRPHNDYLKILTETGLAGLVFLLVLFYFLFKKKFLFSSMFNLSKLLILYLLFQAFLFNILFNAFFFFIFLFLLKNVSEQEEEVSFKSFYIPWKLFLSCLLAVVFIAGYLFPWLSNGFIKKSKEAANLVQAFQLLKKAEFLTPLDQNVYYLKAQLLADYFKKTANLETFYSALDNLKKAQRLNRYFIRAYILESELYLELLNKRVKYLSMDEEITAPLEKAEIYAPFNPFIKLTKARVYFEFNKNRPAKEEAVKAITIEPEFAAALYFLHKNFNYFQDDETFNKKISRILEKSRKLNPPPGHYLFRLFEIPEQYKIEVEEFFKTNK